MAREYTDNDYQKILDLYDEYQSKKDSYDEAKQKQIDAAFWKIVNEMTANKQQKQENPNPIIEWYWWYWTDEWAVYQVRQNWQVEQILKNYNDMADEVIAWKRWVWDARKKALTNAWYDYNKIQEIVNQRMRKPKPQQPKFEFQYTPPENKGALVGTWAVAGMPQFPQFSL